MSFDVHLRVGQYIYLMLKVTRFSIGFPFWNFNVSIF